MSYEKVLLDLMERVASLEERIDALENGKGNSVAKPIRGTYTENVIAYIKSAIEEAKRLGETSVTLTAGKIQREIGLKNRLPLVCNAMRKCMDESSEVLHETPSGQSSTFTVKWNF